MTRQRRLFFLIGAVASAGLLAGCPPLPPTTPQTQPAAHKEVAGVPEAPTLGNGPVAKGVFIAIDGHVPLTGEGLVRAQQTHQQIFTVLKGKVGTMETEQAASAPATQAVAGDDGRGDEAPPLSVKNYLRGRQQFLDGSSAAAMDSLEKALQLDPNSFTVLRLMGRVCFAGSQLSRGAMYLQRAQTIHPQDVEVNYLLGRYWLERNDNDRAVYHLMMAQDSPERLMTSVQTPLSSFYLGIALQQGGYHAAAAKEYEHFIELSELPIAGYRYDGELSYLINMQWASHLSVAENEARVGDYRAALAHYRVAAAARPDDSFIASRLVNALAHNGQKSEAQKAAMLLLVASHGGDAALQLVAWTYKTAGQEKQMLGDLAAFLQGADAAKIVSDDGQRTLVLARAQDFQGDHAGAMETFGKHMARHPGDLNVLAQLLDRVDSADGFGAAMNVAARAIAADQSKADDVLKLFMPLARGSAGAAWEKRDVTVRFDRQALPPKGGEAEEAAARFAALDYLEAVTRLAQNVSMEKVSAAYDAALKWSPTFASARESYVEYLLSQEKFSRASELIAAAAKESPSSPRTRILQIESEAAQQRYVQALQMAQDAKGQFPDNIDVRMKVAALHRARGMDRLADDELQAIIKEKPTYELAYRQLVNSLFARSRRGGSAGDPGATVTNIVGVLNKLAAAVPDSSFGSVMSAVIYARGGRYDEAETVLRGVLVSDPDNSEALVPLSQILQIDSKADQGIALLENALKRKPQLELVRALAGLYRDGDRKADAIALTRRYMEENPDADGYAIAYASELVMQDKAGDAAAILTEAARKFPRSQAVAVALAQSYEDANDNAGAVQAIRNLIAAAGATSERYYLLAHFYSGAGNDDASVAALQQVLAIMPDHIGANNDLGYFWADAGIHLDQAEPMIKKALENKPDDPAFMDSLGWVYYKQGKFAEARGLFEKAIGLPGGTSAEVVRHLGDSLCRLGKNAEAIERWLQAVQLQGSPAKFSATERKERQYLMDAIAAARAGKEPVLTPLAEMPSGKSAGPADAPATMPR